MTFDYDTVDELYSLIKEINTKYYQSFCANIIYIEEHTRKNQIVYIIALRDAYAHLSIILECDDIILQRECVKSHLAKYTNHLERGLIDSFVKVCDLNYQYLKTITPPKEFESIRVQIAQKIQSLRLMSATNDEKITGYQELIRYMEVIRSKYEITE